MCKQCEIRAMNTLSGRYQSGCKDCDVDMVLSAKGSRNAAGAMLAAIEGQMGAAYRKEVAETVNLKLWEIRNGYVADIT